MVNFLVVAELHMISLILGIIITSLDLPCFVFSPNEDQVSSLVHNMPTSLIINAVSATHMPHYTTPSVTFPVATPFLYTKFLSTVTLYKEV